MYTSRETITSSLYHTYDIKTTMAENFRFITKDRYERRQEHNGAGRIKTSRTDPLLPYLVHQVIPCRFVFLSDRAAVLVANVRLHYGVPIEKGHITLHFRQ